MYLFTPFFSTVAWLVKHIGTMLDTIISTFNPTNDDSVQGMLSFNVYINHYIRSHNELSKIFRLDFIEPSLSNMNQTAVLNYLISYELNIYNKILEKLDNSLINIANNDTVHLQYELSEIQRMINSSFIASMSYECNILSDFPTLINHMGIGFSQSKLLRSAWKALDMLESNRLRSNLRCLSNTSLPPIICVLTYTEMESYDKSIEEIKILNKISFNSVLCEININRSLITEEDLFYKLGNSSIIDFIIYGARCKKSVYFSQMAVSARIKLFFGRNFECLSTVLSAFKVKTFDAGSNVYKFPNIITETTLLDFLNKVDIVNQTSIEKIIDFIKSYLLITCLGIYITNRRGKICYDSRKLDDKAFNIIDKRLFTAASGANQLYSNHSSIKLQGIESNQTIKADIKLSSSNKFAIEAPQRRLYPELPNGGI